jgi:alpha-1,2-mannosyltransferase
VVSRRVMSGCWSAAVLSMLLVLCHTWSTPKQGRMDYLIYTGAVRFSAHANLYDFHYHIDYFHFTYPPFAALLIWPFARLSTEWGSHLWWALTWLATVTFLVVCARQATARRTWWWSVPACVAVGVWTMPVLLTVALGQINAFVAAAVVLDVVLLRRSARTSGIGVGIAAAVKLTPFLLVPYLWWSGRRRAAVVAVGTFASCAAVAFALMPSASIRYWSSTVFDTRRVGSLRSGYSSSLRRFIAWLPLGTSNQTILWLLIALALSVLAFRHARDLDARGQLLGAVTVVMCLSYLLSPITWGHHLWFAIPATLLLLGDGRRTMQWIVTAAWLVLMIDPWEHGQGPHVSSLRALALLLFVAVPLERAHLSKRHASPNRARNSAVRATRANAFTIEDLA